MSKTSKGLIWSSIDRFSTQGIQFVLSILIARLVAPSAYGLIVMSQVFLMFAQLFIDSGFKEALIQKKNRKNEDFYTVFLFNFVIAVLLYIILFIAAPFVASFYNEPLISPLLRVVALSLIFSSLSIIQLVKLTISLDFKTQAKVRVISMLISGGVGLYCAYSGWEVWALVIQGVLSSFLTTGLLYFFSSWKPRLIFSYESFKQLFSFGYKLLGANLLTAMYIQITNLIIGKIYLPMQLGFYNRAFTLSQYPSSNICDVISRIYYPILCDLQGDRDSLLKKYVQFIHLSCYIVFPLMIVISIIAYPLTVVVLTAKWLPMVPLLRIFCMVFIFYPLLLGMTQIVNAVGRSDLNLKYAVYKRVVAFLLLAITVLYGPMVIAIGLFFSNFIEMFITAYSVKKAFGLSIICQLKMFLDILLISVISAFVSFIFYLCINNIYMQLFGCVIVFFFVYILLTYLFKMPELKIFLNMIKKK